ncbi:CDP-alcohol phosphatidyltransferase family protein [Stigmatella aurantiaca DW4/3-1]|uniref:CDP-diacylglycerol--glycerol-3-phosphate 3-phosphatidyltransferase n=1 Tax=Stigmatella aurantiaca (strain DW4/3-1) TaxID=378806 RepID=E3FRV2_STIAD|nr:CDP-alcohol phosphatidyltransferase family protein [Stigmatella aurantiaca DW4/3-1]
MLHLLSLSRLGFAVLFLMTSDSLLRAGLVVLAGFTDVLDGWIARHARLTTRLGALIDPVADRGFAVTALFALLLDGLLTPLQVILLLLRDAATAVGFLVSRLVPSLRPVELKARMLGKAVTTLQALTLLAALLVPVAVPALVAVVGVTALASVVDYARAVLRARGRLAP